MLICIFDDLFFVLNLICLDATLSTYTVSVNNMNDMVNIVYKCLMNTSFYRHVHMSLF